MGDFSSRLNVLGRAVPANRARPRQQALRPISSNPYAVGLARPSGSMTPTQRRRRDVLIILGTAAAASFLLALFSRSTLMILVFVAATALLGVYVAVLVQLRRERAAKFARVERAAKVRYLPSISAPNGAAPYRRTMSSSS